MHFFGEVSHVWLGAHAGLKGFSAQMHVKHVRKSGGIPTAFCGDQTPARLLPELWAGGAEDLNHSGTSFPKNRRGGTSGGRTVV